jgi:hypothetical protein
MSKENKLSSLRIAQGLFLLNMVIWLAFGINSLVRLEKGTEIIFLVVALMLLGNGVLMGLAAWLLGKRTIWGYLFAMTLLGINVLTTFTDQVGFLDYATVLVDIILFLLLIYKREAFVGGESNSRVVD